MKSTFKKLSELNYIQPIGGMECLANVNLIILNALEKVNGSNLEFDRKEFNSFFTFFKDEILISILLDEKKIPLNKKLLTGVDFRGIKIRLRL